MQTKTTAPRARERLGKSARRAGIRQLKGRRGSGAGQGDVAGRCASDSSTGAGAALAGQKAGSSSSIRSLRGNRLAGTFLPLSPFARSCGLLRRSPGHPGGPVESATCGVSLCTRSHRLRGAQFSLGDVGLSGDGAEFVPIASVDSRAFLARPAGDSRTRARSGAREAFLDGFSPVCYTACVRKVPLSDSYSGQVLPGENGYKTVLFYGIIEMEQR